MTMPVVLPEELLQHIFSYLSPTFPHDVESRRALRATCLASKQFYRLVQPALYCNTYLAPDPWAARKARALCWRFVQNPQLASLVGTLHIGYWEFWKHKLVNPPHVEEPSACLPGPSVIRALRRSNMFEVLRDRLDTDCAAHLVKSCQRGMDDDANVAMLLAHCTNLECLELIMPDSFRYSCLFKVLTLLSRGRSDLTGLYSGDGFSKLREVDLCYFGASTACRGYQMFEALYMPSLRVLRGAGLAVAGYSRRPGYIHRPSAVREVFLQSSLVDSKGMEFVLCACPLLEVLEISIADDGAFIEINYEEFGEVLRQYGCGLNRLVIDTRCVVYRYELKPTGPLGSLVPLSSLQYLEVCPIALIGNVRHVDGGDPEAEEAEEAEEEGEEEEGAEEEEEEEEADDADDAEEGGEQSFGTVTLADILPKSLQSLDINRSHYKDRNNYNGELDWQLYTVLDSDRFPELSKIWVERPRQIRLDEYVLADRGWQIGWTSSGDQFLRREIST